MSCPGTKVDCRKCKHDTDESLFCLHPESNTHGFLELIKDGSCFEKK